MNVTMMLIVEVIANVAWRVVDTVAFYQLKLTLLILKNLFKRPYIILAHKLRNWKKNRKRKSMSFNRKEIWRRFAVSQLDIHCRQLRGSAAKLLLTQIKDVTYLHQLETCKSFKFIDPIVVHTFA